MWPIKVIAKGIFLPMDLVDFLLNSSLKSSIPRNSFFKIYCNPLDATLQRYN